MNDIATGFGKWVERRRKFLGYERQSDLAAAAELSVSIIQRVESKGTLEGRSRATRKLLAFALRVSHEDLERLERGEIQDVEASDAHGAAAVARSIENLAEEPERRSAVLSRVGERAAVALAKALIDRLASSPPVEFDPAGVFVSLGGRQPPVSEPEPGSTPTPPATPREAGPAAGSTGAPAGTGATGRPARSGGRKPQRRK